MTPDENLKAALEASLKVDWTDTAHLPDPRLVQSIDFVEDPRFPIGSDWPENIPIISHNGIRAYDVPGAGPLPSVTTVIKILGLSTEALVKWSANREREAVLASTSDTYSSAFNTFPGRPLSPSEFMQLVEQHLGNVRQHQKLLEKGGDIGSDIHSAVRSWLQTRLSGEPEPSVKGLKNEVQIALMAFKGWFSGSGLVPVRMEQTLYDEMGFAGTADIIAMHPREGLGILDIKSGKAVYDEYHLQVAAYMRAGKNWADLKWAKIVRLPKTATDPKLEIVELGKLYKRELTEGQLLEAFMAALTAYRLLVWKA